MNPAITRNLLALCASVALIASIMAALHQRQRIANLSSELATATNVSTMANMDTPSAEAASDADPSSNSLAAASVSHDLLRLRAEVTRLSNRQRELAGVEQEYHRLAGWAAPNPAKAPSLGTYAPNSNFSTNKNAQQ